MINFKYYLLENRRTVAVVCTLLLSVVLIAGYFLATQKAVTVLTQAEKYKVVVYGNSTTADALAKAGVELSPYDKVTSSLDAKVNHKETIYVLRNALAQQEPVVVEAVVETAKAPEPKEESKPSSSASSQKPKETKAEDIPAPNVSPTEDTEGNVVDTAGGTYRYSRVLNVTATAYCPCEICCGQYAGGNTADGSKPQAYHTLAMSKDFAFGTNVYIPYFDGSVNKGMFEVEDRGGAIQGTKIDIYFNTHQEALNFGRRTLKIYILE